MTKFRCSACKQFVFKDCRNKDFKGRSRVKSMCSTAGKMGILTKIKK